MVKKQSGSLPTKETDERELTASKRMDSPSARATSVVYFFPRERN
jgi:hypothetical protein